MEPKSDNAKFILPSFSGERDDFQLWWVRFQAYGLVKGYRQALQPTPEGKLPADGRVEIDTSDSDGKEAKAAVERNNLAIAAMTMAFTTHSLINKVHKCQTTEYPGGLAHLLVKDLFKEHQPKDKISKVEAKQ